MPVLREGVRHPSSRCLTPSEIILPEQQREALRVIACLHPFSSDRVERVLPYGGTVADILEAVGIPTGRQTRVFLDDHLIAPEHYARLRPKAGHLLTVRAIPGKGGSGGKNPLRTVLMLAVAAVAIASGNPEFLFAMTGVQVSATTAAFIGLGVGLVGTMLVNAIAPPPRPRLSELSGLSGAGVASSPTYSLTGSSNRANPYGPIPRVFGTMRIFPPLGAQPYTEIVGNDQYLRMLFVVGYGPLALSDFKIGTTPIVNFTAAELEIRQGYPADAPLNLFTLNIKEDALSIALTAAGGWQVRVSQPNAIELSVDIVFPGGLVTFGPQGEKNPRTVKVDVEYQSGSGDWISLNNWLNIAGIHEQKAALDTNLDGAHNDLHFEAKLNGTDGNLIAIEYIQAGPSSVNSGPLSVTAAGNLITVTLAYIGTLNVSTAAEVMAAIAAHTVPTPLPPIATNFDGRPQPQAAASLVTVSLKAGNDGSGVVTPLPSTPLIGGSNVVAGEMGGGMEFSVTESSAGLVRRGFRWPVVPQADPYIVRLRRSTADSTDPLIRDLTFWSALRTVRAGPVVKKSGLAMVVLRIKATDQLNGVVSQFNCLASSILPVWNGTAWVAARTSNPAAIYREILQGSANARPMADSRMDLATLQSWSADNVTKGWSFNAVLDTRSTVFDTLKNVVAMARAAFAMRDLKYSVVQDKPQTVPIQHFSPRNSWGSRGHKVFADLPHALKVRFSDTEQPSQQQERIAYDDPYNADGSGGLTAATKFEVLELFGCTDATLAWKMGRYHLATLRLRPETFERFMDFEHLGCTRGDLVRVTDDVMEFGLGAARLKSVTVDGGGNATAVTMDDVIVMEAGKSYALRIRRSDGASVVQQVTTVAGEQSALTFTVAIPAASAPAVGDLAQYGLLTKETVEQIVQSIELGPDLTAKIILVDAAPAVHTADTGVIPAFDPQITRSAMVLQGIPPMPIVDEVRSDEEVLVRAVDGSLDSRILIALHFASGGTAPVGGVQTRYRRTDSTSQWSQLSTVLAGDGTAAEVSIAPVEDGVSYDIRLRSVSPLGGASDWVTVAAHTVIGKTSKPPDVTTLVLEGRWLRWTYAPPLDMAGFRVKEQVGANPDWNAATLAHSNLLLEPRFLVAHRGGVMSYLAKAVDTSGNESAKAAVVTHDFGTLRLTDEFGDTVPKNLILSTDKKAAVFPDTIVNGSVVGGDLKAADNGALFWQAAGNPFWTLDTAVFWNVQYLEMLYTMAITPDSDKLDALLSLTDTIAADAWDVSYHPDSQAAFWTNDALTFWATDSSTLFWGAAPGFILWPGFLQPLTRQAYTIKIRTAAGVTQGIISQLLVNFDVRDIEETLSNVAIAAGGTRLPIIKTYRVITNVGLTLRDDAGVAEVLRVVDYLASGPLIQAWDGASALTSAHTDARVKGY